MSLNMLCCCIPDWGCSCFPLKCFRSNFSASLYEWTWQTSGFDFPVETDKLHGPIWGMTHLVIRTHDQLLPPQTYSALCSEGVLINQIKLAENWHKNPVAVEVSLNWCPVILLFYSPSQSVRQIDATNKHYHFWNRLQCQIQYLPSKTEHFGINSRIKLLTLIKKSYHEYLTRCKIIFSISIFHPIGHTVNK